MSVTLAFWSRLVAGGLLKSIDEGEERSACENAGRLAEPKVMASMIRIRKYFGMKYF